MWLDQVVVDRTMAGLRDCEVEWVFDKGRLYGREGPPQHLAFIISAAYRSAPRPNAELTAIAEAALRRYFPAMAGARVTRTLVLRETDATFSCDPVSEAIRPGAVTPVRGLVLAGDWTATGLPATIEGAVRSGREAARRLDRVTARPVFPVARWIGLAWLAVWIPAYWSFYGPVVFLNLCDIAVILTCVGLWRGSALLLSSQAVSSLVVDFAWVPRPGLARRSPATTSSAAPSTCGTPRTRCGCAPCPCSTSGFPIVLIWSLRRVGYDRRAPGLQIGIAAVVLAASRAAGAAENSNFAFTDPLLGRSWGPAPVHLAVILGGLAVVYGLTHLALRRIQPPPAAALTGPRGDLIFRV